MIRLRKVESITPVYSEIVEMAEGEFRTYRRSSGANWEVLMGESWEPAYMEENELEAAYREFEFGKRG